MTRLDLTYPDPAANLALDEALLLAAEANGGETLRLWESPTLAVVVGAGGSVAIDVNAPACAADGVPILRRASGGGTVLLGPGCLCFSIVLAYERAPGLNEIPTSNRYVLGRMLNALKPIAPDAIVAGTSDLAVGGRKFSGNAQQRKRTHFLHHGTLLYGFDLDPIPKYLHAPERQPDYRHSRGHGEFVRNLLLERSPFATGGLHSLSTHLKELIAAEWDANDEFEAIPWEAVQELLAAKYLRDEWTRRR